MKRTQLGFTLVEAIIVIAITGVVGAIVAVFMLKPVQGYFDSSRRAELVDATDNALRRMARDVRLALPNSIRNPASQCFEYLPTSTGGRYREACSTDPATGACAASEDKLDFTQADTSFDVLGGMNSIPGAGDRVAIFNLGITNADAYNGDNTAVIASATASRITLNNPGFQFPFSSPGKRFQILPNSEQAVFYICSGNPSIDASGNGTGVLYRYWHYGINSSAPVDCSAPTAAGTRMSVLAKNISRCSFTYAPGATQRNGVVSMSLQMTQKNETVSLYHEVHVSNVP